MNVKPTPIDRQAAPSEGLVSPRPLAAHATASAEAVLTEPVLEDISALAGAYAQLHGGIGGNQHLLPPNLRTPPIPDKGRASLVAADAIEGLRAIAELYADHRIDEDELPALAKARGRLETVLAMEQAIGMLQPPVQRRLRETLFDPLRELCAAAAKHEGMVMGALEQRDVPAFKRRLAAGGAINYQALDAGAVKHRSDINGADRYQMGDPIRVALEGGGWAFGVVVNRREDGALIAEWLDKADHLHLVEMSPEKVAKENPLKIGDTFQGWGHTFWVTGLNANGHLEVIDEKRATYDAFDVLNQLLPLERMQDPGKTSGMFAGDATSKTIFTSHARAGQVALHTHRGHNYKDWNEDAGAAFIDSWGRIYVGVFDQAGGAGQDANAHGAASKIAADAFFEQMRGVAQRHGALADGMAAMAATVKQAHDAVKARGKGEVTTFVGAMIDGKQAHITNLGDSGAMHFDGRGTFIEKTVDQGIGVFIFDGIGYKHESGGDPKPDNYLWNVAPKHYLVLGSDGLLDAGLSEQQIGWIIARAGSAEAATRALKDAVVERMKTGEGKKDNLTIAVVQVGDAA